MKHYLRGDLYEFFTNHSLSELSIHYIMKRVLKAIQFMHRLGYAHRDVKLENIFLDHSDPFPKSYLGDFGLSAFRPPGQFFRGAVGTRRTAAPELLGSPDPQYTESVDMWAFGVTLYEVLTATTPFGDPGEDPWGFINAVFDADDSVEYFTTELTTAKASQDAIDIVLKLLKVNPVDRLTAEQTLEHPFFTLPASVEEVFSPPEMIPDLKDDVQWMAAAMDEGERFMETSDDTH
jgi:serine/threonine protein kinase